MRESALGWMTPSWRNPFALTILFEKLRNIAGRMKKAGTDSDSRRGARKEFGRDP